MLTPTSPRTSDLLLVHGPTLVHDPNCIDDQRRDHVDLHVDDEHEEARPVEDEERLPVHVVRPASAVKVEGGVR